MGALLAAAAPSSFASPAWLSSWSKAVQESKQTGRPILALFTGSDWCPPCKALDGDVFSSPVFASWAKSHVVLVKFDFLRQHPQPAAVSSANEAMQAQFQVSAFPTVLFLSADGRQLGRQSGYSRVGPSFWTKTADYILAKRH